MPKRYYCPVSGCRYSNNQKKRCPTHKKTLIIKNKKQKLLRSRVRITCCNR